jgi:hypothetical protein
MGLSQHGFLVLGYTLAVFLLVCQAVYAVVCAFMFRGKNSSTEKFVTARDMVSRTRAQAQLLRFAMQMQHEISLSGFSRCQEVQARRLLNCEVLASWVLPPGGMHGPMMGNARALWQGGVEAAISLWL